MKQNISTSERTPRLIVAVAAGVAAAYTRNVFLKRLFLGAAAAMLGTVASGYCPVNAVLDREEADTSPRWRTLKTFRVEA